MLLKRSNKLVVHIFIVALLFLGIPWQFGSPGVGYARPANNGGPNDPPDPCDQALTPPGNANGRHKRCDAIGTGAGAAKGDFNGDGFADLAVGVPHEDVNGIGGEGAVNVIYGSATGLTATADQIFFEPDSTANVPGAGDHFAIFSGGR